MSVSSKTLANNLFYSTISNLSLLVYALSFHSGFTVAQARVPSIGNNVNDDNSVDVTVGVVWFNAEPQVVPIKTFFSRLSPDRSFGIDTFEVGQVRGAMIIKGPPGAECTIGTFPYGGGNEFTEEARFKGPARANFLACVVSEPIIDAEFVEQEDVTNGAPRAKQVDAAKDITLDDITSNDDFLNWMNQESDVDFPTDMGDFEWGTNDDDDDDDDDNGWDYI